MTFGFFFILAITSLHDNSIGILSLVFCIAHEFGHLAVMKLMGIRVSEIKLYGAGISIISDGVDVLPRLKQALVYIAGPLANLVLVTLFRGSLRSLNLGLALFNLLPISYFDGGKLLSLVVPKNGGAAKALSATTYVFLAVLVAYAVTVRHDIVSPSSLLTLCFIALSLILDG